MTHFSSDTVAVYNWPLCSLLFFDSCNRACEYQQKTYIPVHDRKGESYANTHRHS